jgi:hypothetical protein
MGKSPAKWIKSVLLGKKSSSKSGSNRTKDLSVGYSSLCIIPVVYEGSIFTVQGHDM